MSEEYDDILTRIRKLTYENEAVRLVEEVNRYKENHDVTESNFLKSEIIRVCRCRHIPTNRVAHKIALGNGKVNHYKAYIRYGDVYIVTQHGISAQAEYDAEIKVLEDWKGKLRVEIVPENETDLRDEYKLKEITHD